MDYKQNKHFFDKEYNKKTNIVFVPASIVFGIGLVLVVLGMVAGYGMMSWIGHIAGWPMMIVSIIFIFISLSRKVKESDMLAITDEFTKSTRDACLEKLDYPADFSKNSVTLFGCVINDENADSAVKLKSGNYLDTEVTATVIYVKKSSVYCFKKTMSLVEDKTGGSDVEIPFTAFDSAKVESEKLKGGVTVHYIRLYNGGEKVYEAPLTDNDYYKEEFCANVMHVRERALK